MMRHPMTPAEFDAACRAVWQAFPTLSESSGRRSTTRNRRFGGSPESKHLLGMARDFVGIRPDLEAAATFSLEQGLWVELEDDHLHVQGLPTGDVPSWWEAKYGRPTWSAFR